MKTTQDMKAFETGLDLFYIDYDRYPDDLEGLEALISPPEGKTRNVKKYFDRLPSDAWGNEYNYLEPTKLILKPRLYSNGPNGIDDKGRYDDIVSWEKKYTCKLNYRNCKPPLCKTITMSLLLAATAMWVVCIFMFTMFLVRYIYNRTKHNKANKHGPL